MRGCGRLHSYATVHLHQGKDIEAPFTVGLIVLDDGPAIRSLLTNRTDDGLTIGDRMNSVLVAAGTDPDGNEMVELRFARAEAGEKMKKNLREMRPVYVVGIGLHRYQRLSETPYVTLGLTAVREALADAALEWRSVESAYTGTALIGMAASRPMLRHLGATGIPMAQVENASASGSTAFRQACIDVASGLTDVSLAVGVDKPGPVAMAPGKTRMRDLVGSRVVPFTHFALLTQEYMTRYGVSAEQIAQVAVKNNRNGANNPYAQRQKAVTLDEVMAGPAISGSLTRLQCCPVGEGAAAVIVASDDAIAELGIDRNRAVKVIASVTKTERVYREAKNFDAELTRETVEQAYREAGIAAGRSRSDGTPRRVHDRRAVVHRGDGSVRARQGCGRNRGGRVRYRRTLRGECVRRIARDGPSDRSDRRRADRRDHAAVARRSWRAPTAQCEDGTRAHGRRRRRLRRAHSAEGCVNDAVESSSGENREAAAAASD